MDCKKVALDPRNSEDMEQLHKEKKRAYEARAIFAILVSSGLIFVIMLVPYPGQEETGKWIIGGFFTSISLFTILISIYLL